MKIRPILFNTEMVRAIQDGRKTQTRRKVLDTNVCPPCEPGDVLWVRETWTKMPHYVYKADDEHPEFWDYDDRWHPSIQMPKEAARIFLHVLAVRMEKLQEITEVQALMEGCYMYRTAGVIQPGHDGTAIEDFHRVWDSTIKPSELNEYGWDANPYVWVIEFERCERPAGWEAYLND